jgi:hypothetical protein
MHWPERSKSLVNIHFILLLLPPWSSPVGPSDSMSDDLSRSYRDDVTLIEVRNHWLTDQYSSSLRRTRWTCFALAPNTIKVRFKVSPVTSFITRPRTPSILTEILSWFSSVSPGKCQNITCSPPYSFHFIFINHSRIPRYKCELLT